MIAEARERGAPRYLIEAAVGRAVEIEGLRPYAPDTFRLWELTTETLVAWGKIVRAEAPKEAEAVDAAILALGSAMEALFAAGFDPALVMEIAEAVAASRQEQR